MNYNHKIRKIMIKNLRYQNLLNGSDFNSFVLVDVKLGFTVGNACREVNVCWGGVEKKLYRKILKTDNNFRRIIISFCVHNAIFADFKPKTAAKQAKKQTDISEAAAAFCCKKKPMRKNGEKTYMN